MGSTDADYFPKRGTTKDSDALQDLVDRLMDLKNKDFKVNLYT